MPPGDVEAGRHQNALLLLLGRRRLHIFPLVGPGDVKADIAVRVELEMQKGPEIVAPILDELGHDSRLALPCQDLVKRVDDIPPVLSGQGRRNQETRVKGCHDEGVPRILMVAAGRRALDNLVPARLDVLL